jgi:hypothetical protein
VAATGLVVGGHEGAGLSSGWRRASGRGGGTHVPHSRVDRCFEHGVHERSLMNV